MAGAPIHNIRAQTASVVIARASIVDAGHTHSVVCSGVVACPAVAVQQRDQSGLFDVQLHSQLWTTEVCSDMVYQCCKQTKKTNSGISI